MWQVFDLSLQELKAAVGATSAAICSLSFGTGDWTENENEKEKVEVTQWEEAHGQNEDVLSVGSEVSWLSCC